MDRPQANDEPDVWDVETVLAYDEGEVERSAPEVLGPTVDALVALAAGAAVLEFAVGTGRVAVPLAARGLAVTGIDSSRPMLDQLRRKVDETTLPTVHGDMATTFVPGPFGLVYLVYNTISNLLTQQAQVACFRNAARHLQRGGRFVVELWVPELRTLPPTKEATVWHVDSGYLGFDTYDVVEQRVVSHHVTYGEGTAARVQRSRHRYVWPSELDLMAQLAGFELEHRWATWTGEPFTATSREHVSVYRLAVEATDHGVARSGA